MRRTDVPLNTAVGVRELCAWQVVRGIVWVQTRHSQHAKRLAKRKDGRLVVRGVAGGFLRTFEFRHSLAGAVRVMARYTAAEETANEGLGGARCPRTNRNPESVVGSQSRRQIGSSGAGAGMTTGSSVQRGGGER